MYNSSQGKRGELGAPIRTLADVTLYDLCNIVIKPATKHKRWTPEEWGHTTPYHGGCSLVELMSTQPQPPSFFVSHWCLFSTLTHTTIITIHRGS